MNRVLVTVLDWGLGHATRCVPVIRELLERKCTVYLAGSGDALALLKLEFPALPSFILPAYAPRYPYSGSMVSKMLLQLPKFVRVIALEHQAVDELIATNNIDLIISDNRYGCWSSRVPAVLITHQTNILMPNGYRWMAGLVRNVNERLINRFSYCWIPDFGGKDSFTGLLNSGSAVRIPVRFIGCLSRFRERRIQPVRYDVVAVLSGPEPQRSLLEKIVIAQFKASGLRCFLVRGVMSQDSFPDAGAVGYANYLNGEDLQSVIEQSTCVIARSGYSTVMDLASVGKKVIFIPTPGQTEQEYLAGRLMESGVAYCMSQERFNLKKAWSESDLYAGFDPVRNPGSLTRAVDEILDLAGLNR